MFKFQSLHAKYFKQPTIERTWFCKKDLDLNCIFIDCPFISTLTLLIVLTGDLAVQEDALKVEKSCFPFRIAAPFFNKFISIFFFINQDLFLFRAKELYLLVILYKYTLSLALCLE